MKKFTWRGERKGISHWISFIFVFIFADAQKFLLHIHRSCARSLSSTIYDLLLSTTITPTDDEEEKMWEKYFRQKYLGYIWLVISSTKKMSNIFSLLYIWMKENYYRRKKWVDNLKFFHIYIGRLFITEVAVWISFDKIS